MKKTALLIMAAGMGSRFGGSKQTTPVDDEGHKIIDFSMYDAKRAGFDKILFIIKEEMYDSFREEVGKDVEPFFEVEYVFQKMETGLCDIPEGRVKPWGTGQAVLAAEPVLDCPFAVVNADDFYGRDAFEKLHAFLTGERADREYAMIGYILKNTVTENGSVSRGVCHTDERGYLTDITERTRIVKTPDGLQDEADPDNIIPLKEDDLISMNIWGFGPEFFADLRAGFEAFMKEKMPENPLKAEYYLPEAVGQAMQKGADVRMIPTDAVWHGVTYREDLDDVKAAVAAMKASGTYPAKLWK